MGTVTTFIDYTQEQVELGHRWTKLSNEIDFSETEVSAADVVQALKIPANTYVKNVYVLVKTAEGATCTATVGDATDPNGWDASTNLNASAGTVTAGLAGTDDYATAGKFYSAADTIDLVMGHAADTGKVIVFADACSIERYS